MFGVIFVKASPSPDAADIRWACIHRVVFGPDDCDAGARVLHLCRILPSCRARARCAPCPPQSGSVIARWLPRARGPGLDSAGHAAIRRGGRLGLWDGRCGLARGRYDIGRDVGGCCSAGPAGWDRIMPFCLSVTTAVALHWPRGASGMRGRRPLTH